MQARSVDAGKGAPESAVVDSIAPTAVTLRVAVRDGASCQFSYSLDGERFISLGTPFTARQGRWVGAKVGLFALRPGSARRAHADFDFFRIAPK